MNIDGRKCWREYHLATHCKRGFIKAMNHDEEEEDDYHDDGNYDYDDGGD